MKTTEEIRHAVHTIIGDILDTDPAKLRPEVDLYDDLGADSLTICEIMMECEEALDVDLPDEMSGSVRTVGAVVEMVTRLTRSVLIG